MLAIERGTYCYSFKSRLQSAEPRFRFRFLKAQGRHMDEPISLRGKGRDTTLTFTESCFSFLCGCLQSVSDKFFKPGQPGLCGIVEILMAKHAS
ncbi:hypothetical protein D3C79_817190 [compost metagenome]